MASTALRSVFQCNKNEMLAIRLANPKKKSKAPETMRNLAFFVVVFAARLMEV